MSGLIKYISIRQLGTHSRIIPTSGSIPKVTGGGPFVGSPHLEPFGNLERAQILRLSRGSTLNSCMDSMICLSTDIQSLTRNINTLFGSVWYQEIKVSEPNKLFHTFDLADSSNLAVSEVKRGQEWSLKSFQHLAGWAGPNLQFEESPTDLEVRGHGLIVIRGSGSLYQLELDSGQEILVSANSFIGTTGSAKMGSFDFGSDTKGITEKMSKAWGWVKHAAGAIVDYVYIKRATRIGKHSISENFSRSDLRSPNAGSGNSVISESKVSLNSAAYRVSGPGILMLQNSV